MFYTIPSINSICRLWQRMLLGEAECRCRGRSAPDISAVVGYAGGTKAGPDGKVCYYYADPRTVYDSLGHAEVVKVDLEKDPETEF